MTYFGDVGGAAFMPLTSESFFTGKPFVADLGHVFLFRNYRSDLGKWQTADPLGYPNGWNRLAYCVNPSSYVDLSGALIITGLETIPNGRKWGQLEMEHDGENWNEGNNANVVFVFDCRVDDECLCRRPITSIGF